MTWPFNRLQSFVRGTPIPSTVLNGVQDYIANLFTPLLSMTKARFDGVGNQSAVITALLELLGSSSISTVTPLFAALNGSGKIRTIIDRNGYLMGFGVVRVVEPWLLAPGASGSIWSQALSAGANQTAQNPSANYGTRYIQITPSTGTTAGSVSVMSTPLLFMPNASFLSAVLEFEIGLNAAAQGVSSNVSFVAGFDNGNDPVNADNQFAYLKKQNNIANWTLANDDGGITNITTSTVAPSANPNNIPADRVKIEIHGSGSPFGAQMTIWVNEVIIGTITTHLPTAAQRILFGCGNEGGAAPVGSPLAYIGPVKCSYNYMLSPPAI